MQKVIQLQQCQIRFLIKHVSKEIADLMPSTASEEMIDETSLEATLTGPIDPTSSQRGHHAVYSDPSGLSCCIY